MPITDGFTKHAQHDPEKPAVVLHHTHYPVSRRYGELLTAAQQIAAAIISFSRETRLSRNRLAENRSLLPHSVCVGLLLPNRVEFLEVFLGVAIAGGVSLVLDPKWTPTQIHQVLCQSMPDLLCVDAALIDSTWLSVLSTLLPPIPVVVIPPLSNSQEHSSFQENDRFLRYGDWQTTPSIEPPTPPSTTDLPFDDLPFYVGFTSGTTGHPKGVVRHHRSWMASFAASQIEFGTCETERILVPGSLVHSLSLYAALDCLNAGATLHLLPKFSAKAALHCLSAHAVTMAVAVPTLWRVIAKTARVQQEDYSSLRVAIAGGSKLDTHLRGELSRTFPSAKILEYFGALELSFISIASSQEQIPLESVGRSFQGVTLSIRKTGGTGEAAIGEVGWIGIKSPMVSLGYLTSSDTTGYRIIDGWATVGDLGWCDADGYLYLVGREQDMIISGGLNIYPAEVEQVLQNITEIEEAVVFGVPDGDRGQAIAAAIRWTGVPLSRVELQNRLHAVLPRPKCPRYFYQLQIVPSTPSGKVMRSTLQEQALQGDPNLEKLL